MTNKTPIENEPLYVAGGNRVICHRHSKGYTLIARLENPNVGCFICEREEKAASGKTPIEKVAEDIRQRYERFMYPEDEPEIADIIRRRLETEVEERITHHSDSLEQELIDDGHNQCRRDIGLRYEEEEA